jgi:anti-sigma regulatory factor (Ser/Thr protein kinase)
MAVVGYNPGRVIEAWHTFLSEQRVESTRQPLRGVGEPVSPERSAAALAECHTHEALLNLAFEDAGTFWLVCPYDTSVLDASVVDEARRNHPFVQDRDGHARNNAYEPTTRFDDPLSPAPLDALMFTYDRNTMAGMRNVVAQRASDLGFDRERTGEFLVAVNEAATNSVCHGGGAGHLLLWDDGDMLVCEVRDEGRIDAPLVGRLRPGVEAPGGYGLWLANQLCDLVQIRSGANGTVVRLHKACRAH